MAEKGKIPPQLVGKGFKKGVSGNPSGKPPLTPEEKRLQAFTKKEVAKLLNVTCSLTTKEMRDLFNNDDTPAIKKLFVKVVIDGLNGDSVKAAEFILNRTVGKPTENVQITSLRRAVRKLDGTLIEYSSGNEDE